MATILKDKYFVPPVIAGAGGGGGGGGGTEDPDTLQSHAYMTVVDLLGEGQIGGLVTKEGVLASDQEREKAIFFNGTSLRSEGGTLNFQSVTWSQRVGTQDQPILEGINGVETPHAVNVELKPDIPSTFVITNPRVDRVRITLAISALMTNTDEGDIRGASVEFDFMLSVNGGAYAPYATRRISGKASSRYQRSYVMALKKTMPDGTPITRWSIQVIRKTPDQSSAKIQDTTYFDSYSEIISTKLNYPNSALVATRFSSEAFSSMPKREYLVDGLLIKVPSNYDPVKRTYFGTWDGTFKLATSSNPAWILYDLLLNARYGLGEYIDPTMVDEARLYQIGQYCDQMVDDGFGNKEPRYQINCVLNSRVEAYDLMVDICSAFNGMAFWNGDIVGFMIDAPSDPVMSFTSANIKDSFSYTGTSVKDRHSVAMVTWNDPSDNYKQVVEYVEDRDLIERYGLRKAEIQAFGCTSRGQAHRFGRWLLYTEHQQSETVAFTAGLDASLLIPGDIINIQDPDRAGKRLGGRIVACGENFALLDDVIDFTGFASPKIAIALEDGTFAERTIATHSQERGVINGRDLGRTLTRVTWVDALPSLPVDNAVWVISSLSLELVQARVVNVKQGEEPGTVEITAVPHNPNKYLSVENDMMLEVPRTSMLNSRGQEAPAAVRLRQEVITEQGVNNTRLIIDWDAVEGASQYQVEWLRNDGNWVQMPLTANTEVEIDNVYAGTYTARVQARNVFGAKSYYTYSLSADISGQKGKPANVVDFSATGILFGMRLNWVFSGEPSNISHVSIEVGDLNDVSKMRPLADVAQPSNSHVIQGMQGGLTQYYRIKTVDKSGNESDWSDVISGTTSADPEALLEILSGHISKSTLDTALSGNIDLINSDLALNKDAIAAETAARIADVNAKKAELQAELQQTANTINSSVDSKILSEAQARNAAISAKATELSTSISAVDTKVVNETNARVAAISKEVTDRNAAITAKATELSSDISAVDTKVVNETNARITAITQEVTDRNAAIAAKATELSTSIAAVDSKVSSETTARIAAVAQEVTDRNAAIAAKATELTAQMDSKVAALDSAIQLDLDALQTGITNEAIARTEGDTAVTSALNAYKTSNDAAVATVLNKAESAISGNTANATAITALESKVNTNDSNARALIASEATTRSSADTALGGRIDTLTTTVSNNDTTVRGLITNVQNSVTTLEGNTNTSVTKLTSDINNINLRGQDLVSNGLGQLMSNKYWEQLTFTAQDKPAGAGSFRTIKGSNAVIQGSELIPIDPSRKYKFAYYMRQLTAGSLGRAYGMITPYDVDKQVILPQYYMARPGTLTTLAQPLKKGDTTITLTSGANWINDTTDSTKRAIIVWNYVDKTGYAWPVETYSRNYHGNIYDNGAVSGNVITLRNAWTGPEYPAGVPLSNGSSGGNFMYMGAINTIIPEMWTQYTGMLEGVHPSATLAAASTKLPMMTAYVGIGFLPNRVSAGGADSTSQHAVGGMSLRDWSVASDPALASSSALTALDTKVTNIDGRVTTNASSISSLTSRMTTVEGKAQQGIDAAASAQTTANTGVTQSNANATAISSLDTKFTTKDTEVRGLIATEESSRASADTAINTRIDTLTSTVNSNDAAVKALITTEETARADADSALSGQITSLQSSVNTALGTKADASALNNYYTKTQTDSAISASATTLTSNYNAAIGNALRIPDTRNDNQPPSWYWTNYKQRTVVEFKTKTALGLTIANQTYGTLTTVVPWTDASGGPIQQTFTSADSLNTFTRYSVDATTWSAWKSDIKNLQAEVATKANATALNDYYTKTQADAAIASSTNALKTTVDSQIATTNASIVTESNARSTADIALGDRIDALTSTFNTADGEVRAQIAAEETARATADTALSGRIDTLTATVNANDSDVRTLIASESTARATADTATGTRIDALTTTVQDNNTAVNGRIDTVSQSVSTLEGNTNTSLTNLQSSLNDLNTVVSTKADATALNALDSRVTTVEGTVTSQGSSITQLSSSLAKQQTNLRLPTEYDSSQANKWLLLVLNKAADTGTQLPTYDMINNLPYKSASYVADGSTMVSANDNVIYAFRTFFYVSAAKTLNFGKVVGDDAHALYIDGVAFYSKNSYTISPTDVTCAVSQGWHTFDVLVNEISGADGFTFPITLSSQVTSMFAANLGSITNTKADTTLVNTKADATALNALTTRVTTAEGTISSQGTSITTINSNITKLDELTRAMNSGKLVYTDPLFKSGLNSVGVYNNSNNGLVTHTRRAKSVDNPTTSTHELAITVTGAASPGFGGFYQMINSRANAVFLVKYIFKLPVGYSLVTAANALGNGGTDKLYGQTSGTGKYETCYRITRCGPDGSFSTGGHLYVTGSPTPTSAAPLEWVVASIECYDCTDFQDAPQTVLNSIANAQTTANTAVTESRANANAISSLTTTVNANNAAVNGRIDTVANSVTTLEGNTNTRFSTLESNLTAVDTKANTGIANAATAQSTADTAVSMSNANAADITALDARLTTAETDLATKADASALSSLDSKVTAIDGRVTSNSGSITNLQNSLTTTNNTLATKADTSVLDALTTRVTSAEGNITSQGSSITAINNKLGLYKHFKVRSAGYGASTPGGITRIDAGGSWNTERSYGLTVFNSSGDVASHTTYDVYGGVTGQDAFNTAVANLAAGTYVAVTTYDEPASSAATIKASLISLGASAKTINSLVYRGAYLLIGRKGLNEGQGLELISTTSAGFVETVLTMINGIPEGLGGVGSMATAVNSLDSSVSNIDGRVTTNSNNITSLSGRIAAAENGLTTKADATALTALDSKVTTIDGKVTTNTSDITALENSISAINNTLNAKADASALNALDSEVTAIDGRVTANTNSITSLQGSVTTINNTLATKADASALSNYYTKTQADSAIAGQVNSLSAALQLQGDNLVRDGGFETLTATTGMTIAYTGDKHSGTKCLKFVRTSPTNSGGNNDAYFGDYFTASEGRIYYVEAYVRKDPSAAVAAASGAYARIGINFQNLAGGNQWLSVNVNMFTLSDTWTKVSGYITCPAGFLKGRLWLSIPQSASNLQNTSLLIDDVFISDVTEGRTAVLSGEANATAINNLTSTVTQQGNTLTSQGNSITALNNSLTTTNDNVTAAQNTANNALNAANAANNALSTKADASTVSALDSRVTSAEGAISSQGTSITNLQNSVSTINGTLANKADVNALSSLDSRVTVAENAITSQGASITSLNAGLTNANARIDANAEYKEYVIDASALNADTYYPVVTRIVGMTVNFRIYVALSKYQAAAWSTHNSKTFNVEVEWTETGSDWGAQVINRVIGKSSFAWATQSPVIKINQLGKDSSAIVYVRGGAKYDFYVSPNAPAPTLYSTTYTSTQGEVAAPMSYNQNEVPVATLSTKADASALNALTTRVTNAEGVNSSQGTSITNLQNSVNTINTTLSGKADSSALSTLQSTVTTQGQTITSQGTAITDLQNSLATTNSTLSSKADVSALNTTNTNVTAIDGRVTTNTNNITALQGSVTTINNTLNTKADSSALNNYYTKTQADTAIAGQVSSYDASLVVGGSNLQSGTKSGGFTEYVAGGTLTETQGTFKTTTYKRVKSVSSGQGIAANANNRGVVLRAGQTYVVTAWVRGNAPLNYVYMMASKADGANTAMSGGATGFNETTFVKAQYTFTAPADRTNAYIMLSNTGAASGTWFEIAEIMVQEGTKPTDWSPSPLDVQSALNANANAASALDSRVTTAEGNITSQGASITTLNNSLNNLTNTVNTKADASALNTTNTNVSNLDGRVTTNATNISSLQSSVNTLNTTVASKADASALTNYYTKAQADSAISASSTTLTSNYTTAINNAVTIPDTRSTNEAPSWYWTNYPRRVVNEFKQGSAIGSPGGITGYGNLQTLVPWSDSSGGAIQQVFSTGDSLNTYTRYSTSTTAWSAWKSDVKNLQTSLNSKADASVLTNYYTKAEADSAIAASNSALTTTLNGHTTTLNEHSNSINGIEAIKTVTIDNNGVLSGYGLMSELKNGQVTSGFGVNADSFFIGSPTTGKKPFIVTTSTQVINGTSYPPGTWIDSAYIASATIKSAQIQDAAITNTKIANAAITSAKIADAAITTAKIQDGQITSAKIDNAAITSAKIGDLAVDTLKIADQAVTVSVAGQNVDSLTITCYGGKVRVECGVVLTAGPSGYSDTPTGNGYRILRNGIVLVSYFVHGTASTSQSTGYLIYYPNNCQALPTFVDTPGPGTHTYVLQCQPYGAGSTWYKMKSLGAEWAKNMPSISLMETKK